MYSIQRYNCARQSMRTWFEALFNNNTEHMCARLSIRDSHIYIYIYIYIL